MTASMAFASTARRLLRVLDMLQQRREDRRSPAADREDGAVELELWPVPKLDVFSSFPSSLSNISNQQQQLDDEDVPFTKDHCNHSEDEGRRRHNSDSSSGKEGYCPDYTSPYAQPCTTTSSYQPPAIISRRSIYRADSFEAVTSCSSALSSRSCSSDAYLKNRLRDRSTSVASSTRSSSSTSTTTTQRRQRTDSLVKRPRSESESELCWREYWG
ncbi:hypothetical protein F5Y16DRAFT_64165 [Xylariaceae sp. FL0255]|nr:hypothetical protein F5Y16DRAFT_64165 [Xylariaceae sp. FL0255]